MGGVLRWQRPQLSADGGDGGARWLSDCGGDGGGGDYERQYDEGRRQWGRWLHWRMHLLRQQQLNLLLGRTQLWSR